MKRTYSDQEMTRILRQELVVPEKVNLGMQEAYEKLGITKTKTHTSFIKRKAFRVLAAAAVLAAGSSLVVFAANKFLSANLVKEKETVTYDLAIDHGQEAHEIEAEPTYMPEGYTLMEKDRPLDGKWHNAETGGSITIVATNAAELDELIRLGNADLLTHGLKEENLKKELDINGMKVALFLSESFFVDSDKKTVDAMLFNEDEGYLVQIFNMDSRLPMEETIKIAEGLDIRVLDSTVPYKTDEEIESLLAEQKAMEEKNRQAEINPKLLADNNFFSFGEELKVPFIEDEHGMKPEDIRYTVESIEIKDALPVSEYPIENYKAYEEEMAAWINEDGSLKPHERLRHSLDENGNPTEDPTVETVNSKFVVVHMKVKNNNEVNQFHDEIQAGPDLRYLKKDANGKYFRSDIADIEYIPANEGYDLQYGFPVYFDKIYYTEGIERLMHSNFVPMEPGDEMEYTVAYVVDEDRLDSAFFQFYSEYTGWPVPEGGNEYVYVKAVQ